MQDTNRQFANQTVGSVNSPNRNKKLVSKSILPIMCEDCVSPTTLLVDGWAANSPVISPTAAQSNGSISRLRRATAPTTTARVGTPYIKISARRRRIERALQLLQPISPDGAFGQNVGRLGPPKNARGKGVKKPGLLFHVAFLVLVFELRSCK